MSEQETMTDLHAQAPLLSILVPIFRTEKQALHLVQQLEMLDRAEVEILLLFDGSSDQRDAFEGYARSGRFRILEHETNKGLAQARRSLGQAARGTYLWHHDADDLPVLDNIASLLTLLANSEQDILEFNAVMQRQGGAHPLYGAEKVAFLAGLDELTLVSIQHQYIAQNIWNKVIKREFWNAATQGDHGAEEALKFTLGEDLFYSYLLFGKGCSYRFHDMPIYNYFQHGASSSGNLSTHRIQRNFEDIELVFGEIEKRMTFDDVERERFEFQKAANLFYSCVRGRIDIRDPFKPGQVGTLPAATQAALQQSVRTLSGTFKVTKDRLIRRQPHMGWLHRPS